MTFDHLQAICWSITYVFLIIYAVKFKTHGIPLLAICLNFAWETLALVGSLLSSSFSIVLLIHIAWFSLDLVMVCLFMVYESGIKENRHQKMWVIYGYLGLICGLSILFHNGYMLLSCFVIDLIMAISFLWGISFKHMKKSLILYVVGTFKLLGDMFAWRYYRSYFGIELIGIIVLICNTIYLFILAVKKSDDAPFNLKTGTEER